MLLLQKQNVFRFISTTKTCESCKELFAASIYETHLEFCKIYFKCMKKSSNGKGYDCRCCKFRVVSNDDNAKNEMYDHLKNKSICH